MRKNVFTIKDGQRLRHYDAFGNELGSELVSPCVTEFKELHYPDPRAPRDIMETVKAFLMGAIFGAGVCNLLLELGLR